MEEYQFYRDQKVTIWERTHFAIHADSEEAAILKAAAIDLENMETADDPQIVILANEVLYDTVEELPITKNNGKPTVERLYTMRNSTSYPTMSQVQHGTIGGKRPICRHVNEYCGTGNNPSRREPPNPKFESTATCGGTRYRPKNAIVSGDRNTLTDLK